MRFNDSATTAVDHGEQERGNKTKARLRVGVCSCTAKTILADVGVLPAISVSGGTYCDMRNAATIYGHN